MTQDHQDKQRAIDILRARYDAQRMQVTGIEERLTRYFDDLVNHSSVIVGDANDQHNYYELLSAIKFLRLLRTYEFNGNKLRKVLRMREGDWRRDGKIWRFVRGGLRCPGTSGAQVYRWEPFQVFVLANVFGFQAWIDTEVTINDRETLLPTERLDGERIMDARRLCTDFTFYGPRKTDKTGLSAFLQTWFFFFEDNNAEVYCTANSSDQSKILYRRTKAMLQQLDNLDRLRITETVCEWKDKYKQVRDSSIRPLSAGGKTKDGMFAQLCCADEYGSAGYVNGKSDMKMLVDVVQSSMGPRREPLTFTTTTAGRVTVGPFIDKLSGLHRLLERELLFDDGTETPSLSDDRMLCLCLEPDVYEREEDFLLSSLTVRKKVNPMLGKIVQHQFYNDSIAKARMEGDTEEVVSKLFNVYTSENVEEWLTKDEIKALQVPVSIDDCTAEKGWLVFAGLDFSKGDDLNGISYMAINTQTGEFFGDMDSYISEEAVNQSPIGELYRHWEKEGWIHIVPGKTFDPSWPVNRIIELHTKGVNFAIFGYDPYNAKIVTNALGSWVYDLGVDPKDVIVQVPQNFKTYNSAVAEFDYMVKRCDIDEEGKSHPNPMIHLSMNPMWPWQFGNCILKLSNDGNDNKKPVKKSQAKGCKVDNVQMLLSALIGYDMMEGNIQE